MTDVQAITAVLRRTFPVPEVDPGWVKECAQALIEAGSQANIENVQLQYLHSDLAMSTLESRTFPRDGSEIHERILFPKPALLQIHALSEVGNSAFQIQTVREQRSEILSGQSRIRRLDDEAEDEMEDGKVPPYPRSMLRLEVGDGRRIMKAMEYKRIAGLVLGQTSLGCKLLVQNVRCLRDTLLLTPANTQVLESSVEHLEDGQKEQFINDLKRRMGKFEQGDAGGSEKRAATRARGLPPPVRPPAAAVPNPRTRTERHQSPVAQTQAGPSRLAQGDAHAPLFGASFSSPPIVRPTAMRHAEVKTGRRTASPSPEIDDRSPSRLRKSARNAATSMGKSRQAAQSRPVPSEPPSDDFDVDFSYDESMLRQIAEVEAHASARGQYGDGKQNGESDYGGDDNEDFMILDDSMIRQLDEPTTRTISAVSKEGLLVESRGGVSGSLKAKSARSDKVYRDPDDGQAGDSFDVATNQGEKRPGRQRKR
ncbi:hypothetical protein IAU60_006567 [Kwoniella sp. DSM 27419]